jgi:large subunit ribosomal protein L18
MANNSRAEIRRAVHSRIRKKVRGTAERPRLAIFRSVNHIYAQVIDDENGKTLAAAATTEKDLKGSTGGNTEAAQRIGKAIAERALAAGISNVVYDRGGYVYHGRVKALFEATRAAGLNKSEVEASADAKGEASEPSSTENTASSAVEKPEKKARAKKGDDQQKAQA